ncbi:2-oxoglutarate (2OG) and Fe(II)-dependent oxygenase superfamily protein [Striga asiatica]|uniref:2-oxoglutarate (2OG) and Fe(II)-dependent oxygenase superfamily protein n=1 Tax=Striga asiatica TaxID=4170 RepID=A0A5A7NWP9_STRAF|nr:2-oxoglutarate (2OG) and Fe(II)-dependent oxygenase superfamily protein [Striga asiatica]
MEKPPQIRRFHELPSAEEFASRIEPRNVPAVFSGCVKSWKAFSKWDMSSGGLDYLQELVGSSVVGAMISSSAPVFYGDIRSHERVPLPFSTFIRYCKDLLQSGVGAQDSNSPLRKHKQEEHIAQHGNQITEGECSQQIYLAQVVPIMNAENEENAQLEWLREDIEIPVFLDGKKLASINLWMNSARTRSSTHYDPHQNLLCIISGCKQVVLWPPSACPFLYPLPLYGESSNHSAIPLENTNFSLYPRAKLMDEYSQKVILHAGDAVFIPEGWFHQVDSENLTIAVNFWWRSDIMSSMSDHMDAYYLRRILKRYVPASRLWSLVVRQDRMLGKPSHAVNKNIAVHGQPSNGNAVHHNDDTMDRKDIAASGQPGNDNDDLVTTLSTPSICWICFLYFASLEKSCWFIINNSLFWEYNVNMSGHQKEDLCLNNRTATVKENEQEFSLHELQPHALKSLHELVSLVHNLVNQNQSLSIISADRSISCPVEEDEVKRNIKTDIYNLEADAIANVVWNLDPCTFRSVFLAMAHNFPRTLEALVMHGLSSVGAEVLTRKFEQMDQVISEDDRSQFYQKFYSVFDNQFSAMDTLLNGKESFARQAFNNVLVHYLGTNLDRAKPSVE